MVKSETISNLPNLSKSEIKELISQSKKHIKLADKINPYRGDTDWQKNINKDKWWAKGYTGEIEERCKKNIPLRDRLLEIGGCEVCMPAYEEDLEDITEYGQLWDNIGVKMMKGRPGKCHGNSAELWYNNKDTWRSGHALIICTGYALSADGFWRQHSWLVHTTPGSNSIIETTEPRIAYYGFGMTYEQATEFEENNY